MTAPAGVCSYDASRYGLLHDAQYDYFGQRLATASADGHVRIWNARNQELLQELRAHKAPAVSISWAHGRFAGTLASVASDGHVTVWREAKSGEWQVVHQMHVTGPVAGAAFCPPEYGLTLAIAGADALGVLTLLVRREVGTSAVNPSNDQWQVKSFPAHDGGMSGLSWAPSISPATLATGPAVGRGAHLAGRRLVTGGVDGAITVWAAEPKTDIWKKQHDLADERHVGVIRDVAWRPNMGIPSSVIATCTEDGSLAMWTQEMEGQPWQLQTCWTVQGDPRRLAWSHAGSLLSVSVGEDICLLFKEAPGGEWEQVKRLEGE